MSGQRLNGNYHTFGTSLSAEYGKRIKKQNGFYIDPSVEFILGRLMVYPMMQLLQAVDPCM